MDRQNLLDACYYGGGFVGLMALTLTLGGHRAHALPFTIVGATLVCAGVAIEWTTDARED